MPARVFFALVPPAGVQAELGRLAGWCERRCGGQAVMPENLHLTLLFAGELVPGQIASLQRAAASVRWAPFEVALERIEYWAGPRLLKIMGVKRTRVVPVGAILWFPKPSNAF